MTHTDYANPVQMRRSYKFLLRPTSKQVTALEACLEDHREIWNAGLQEWRDAWKMRGVRIDYYAQAKQLPEIRADDLAGQGRWSSGSQQQTLRRLDQARVAFYRRCKAGKKPGYPRFKGRGRFNMVRWAATKGGARWDSQPHNPATRVYLKGIGHIRVHQHRAVKGRLKMITVKRETGRWYVILSCDDVQARPLPTTGTAVGIDVGLTHFLSTSDGKHVPNPRHLAASADRLAEADRSLARKKRGSKRRRKAIARLASLHGKVRRSRLDHAHKTALELVRDHDVIVHEVLRIKNMTRSPAPRLSDEGTFESNGASAKAGLNKAILDAGWGVLLRVLADKAEDAGRTVIAVDPRGTSRRCAQCGHVARENRDKEKFRCLACGHTAHADVNAAINILRAGLARQANAA